MRSGEVNRASPGIGWGMKKAAMTFALLAALAGCEGSAVAENPSGEPCRTKGAQKGYKGQIYVCAGSKGKMSYRLKEKK